MYRFKQFSISSIVTLILLQLWTQLAVAKIYNCKKHREIVEKCLMGEKSNQNECVEAVKAYNTRRFMTYPTGNPECQDKSNSDYSYFSTICRSEAAEGRNTCEPYKSYLKGLGGFK